MLRRLLPLVVLLPVLAACGGAEAPEPAAATRPDPAADRRAVQERTAAYLRAYVAGDGRTACAQLSPALRRDLDARARTAGTTCAAALGRTGPALLETLPAERRPAFAASIADPARIRVELDNGVARAGFAPPGEGRVPARVLLERVGGRWLISRLGAQAPPAP